MRPQIVRQREPLSAFADRGELAVSLLLDRASASLEGEELVVSDARQPLSRSSARADLHPTVETDVVDDVDTGEREIGVGDVPVTPSAGGAAPGVVTAGTDRSSAEGARARESLFLRHRGRLRAPSDTCLFCGARRSPTLERRMKGSAMTTTRRAQRTPADPRVAAVARGAGALVSTALVSTALIAIALAACAPTSPASSSPAPLAPSPSAGSGSIVPGRASTVAAGLEAPWSIAFFGSTALISERDTARIVEVSGDGRLRELGMIDGVAPRGEGGLLGIALRDDWLYAYSTAVGENRVQRFALSGAPGSFELGESETILSGIPAAGNHNGGRIAFGPDDMLYVTVGDAGDREGAQDRDSLAGKILRITPDGDVPEDNPFPGSPIYSLGHRNPQGLAWDDEGTLYASEFGQDTWDELNVIEAGGNYGWPTVEGIADHEGFVDPVQQWSPDTASPSGITIASGSIFIANLRGERLREVPLSDVRTAGEYFVESLGRLRDVVVAPDGALWVLTNNTDGRGDPREGDDRVLRIPIE